MMSDAAKQIIEQLKKRNEELGCQYQELKEMFVKAQAVIEAQAQDIKLLRFKLYGRSSEKGLIDVPDSSQPDLFEDMSEATEEEVEEEVKPPKRERRSPKTKKMIPDHLPRKEEVIDLPEEEKVCAKCGKELKPMKDAVTEILEYTPAQVFVRRIVRRKYACNCCKEHFAEAPYPDRVIPRSKCGDSLLAALIISKYADHLPLYRQEKMFARHKIHLTRNVMCTNLMEVARQLRPLIAAMKKKLLDSSLIGADETTIRMVKNNKKGEGKSKLCYLWVYRGDEKVPYVVFDFKQTRAHSAPLEILRQYKGGLLSDGYSGYEALLRFKDENEKTLPITHYACWAHVRRKFHDAMKAGDSRATKPIGIIGDLYKVEKEARALGVEEKIKSKREKESTPIIKKFFDWIDDCMDVLPKSKLGDAIQYANNRRKQLERYAQTGNVPIDNNAVERAIRPVAIGRKNWLFAGSEMGGEAAATFFTLIESAKRCGVEPWIYIQTLLQKIIWHSDKKLDDLFPDKIQLPADEDAPTGPIPAV